MKVVRMKLPSAFTFRRRISNWGYEILERNYINNDSTSRKGDDKKCALSVNAVAAVGVQHLGAH
jgi:hypothetical protein